MPHRPRGGIRHDDGPLCPIERRRAHRASGAFLVAGAFLAFALMLAHALGFGLDQRPSVFGIGL